MSWLWPFGGGTREGDVFWTARAQGEFRAGLAGRTDPERSQVQGRLTRRLCAVFPDRCRLLVVNLLRGFRPHPDQFVLHVEVEHRPHGVPVVAPHVVKVYFGPARGELEKEGTAWERCWPNGPPPGPVLMRVRPVRNRRGSISALVYQEATTAIGAPTVVSLEDAVLDCVRYNNPSVADVQTCFHQLYQGLGALHVQGRDDPPAGPASTFPRTPSLDRSLALWADFDPNHPDGNRHREHVRRISINSSAPFIDPVDYLAYVRDRAARGIGPAGGPPLVPTTWRGWVHGDLHGRNVLVGVGTNQRLTFPAVFDYGKLEPDQPVALDFVKLETELKIRALPALFDDMHPQSRNPLVQEFEHVLNRWTRHAIDHNSWRRPRRLPSYWPPHGRAEGTGPPAATGGTREPREPPRVGRLRRLLAVLLDLRSHAARALRDRSVQPGDWFRQYLFWLAYYGVRVVRFTNLDEHELLAAYVSAGVAAAELQ